MRLNIIYTWGPQWDSSVQRQMDRWISTWLVFLSPSRVVVVVVPPPDVPPLSCLLLSIYLSTVNNRERTSIDDDRDDVVAGEKST